MMPNNEQLMSLAKLMLALFGGMAITLGWLTKDQVSELTASVLAALGPTTIAGGIIWSLVSRSKVNILKSAAAIPEVKAITLHPQMPESAGLDKATPTNVKVGTT